MSDIKVCRICLCKGVKVYNYDSFHLKQYYEEIMARKVNEKDGLPNYFCFECAAVLYKFHKFKEKCWIGEKALKELLWSGSITLTSISQIDRKHNHLQSSLDIITISNKVKTYIVKNKTLSKSLVKDTKEDEIPERENYIVEYLDEIKNETINKQTESILDGKTNNENGVSVEEKALSDLEDDRMFSDDDDSNSETINVVVDKTAINEDINIEKEEIHFNTEQANRDKEVVLNTNHKENERKKDNVEKDFMDTKAKKFKVPSKNKNYLDPNHWLKINLTEDEALEEFKARAQDRKYMSAAFQCSDCYKGFSKLDMLNRHIKLRHSESLGPVECRFCKMRFKWKCKLTRHITQHYTRFKCLRCELVCLLESTALLHNDYHNGVIIKCIHCEEEFRHQSTYYTHLRSHRSDYVCSQCGASFVSTVGLKKHQRTMHINTVVNPEEAVTHTDTYCERCDIKFDTQQAYQKHVLHSAKHTEGVEDLESAIPDPAIPKGDRRFFRRNPRRSTSCNLCNRNFSSLAAYMKHHTEEHKDEPLPSNSKKEKTNVRQICEICGISLAPGSVASHLNTHTHEKMYTCNTCGRNFNSKTGLNNHHLTHTNEKPVACTLCDKRFKQSSSMKLHYRTYHLKEPYPKRNRKKKNDHLWKDESDEDSDDNMTLDMVHAGKN